MKFLVFSQKKKSDKFEQTIKKAKELHNKDFYKDAIYCPYCGEKLVMQERAERLCDNWEGVTCSEPSYKLIYKCINTENCPHGHFTKYLKTGEMYVDNIDGFTPDEQAYVKNALTDDKYFGDFSNDALNSISFKCHCETYNPENRIKELRLLPKSCKYVPTIEFNYIYDGFGKCKYVIPKFYLRKYTEENLYQIMNLHKK